MKKSLNSLCRIAAVAALFTLSIATAQAQVVSDGQVLTEQQQQDLQKQQKQAAKAEKEADKVRKDAEKAQKKAEKERKEAEKHEKMVQKARAAKTAAESVTRRRLPRNWSRRVVPELVRPRS